MTVSENYPAIHLGGLSNRFYRNSVYIYIYIYIYWHVFDENGIMHFICTVAT